MLHLQQCFKTDLPPAPSETAKTLAATQAREHLKKPTREAIQEHSRTPSRRKALWDSHARVHRTAPTPSPEGSKAPSLRHWQRPCQDPKAPCRRLLKGSSYARPHFASQRHVLLGWGRTSTAQTPLPKKGADIPSWAAMFKSWQGGRGHFPQGGERRWCCMQSSRKLTCFLH